MPPSPDKATAEKAAAGTWRGWWDTLCAWDRPAADKGEAMEAPRLAIECEEHSYSPLTTPMMKAALGYFETAGTAGATPETRPPVRSPYAEQWLRRFSGEAQLFDDMTIGDLDHVYDALSLAIDIVAGGDEPAG